MDRRHKKRIVIIQELFRHQFDKRQSLSKQAKEIIAHLVKIDSYIQQAAPKYEVSKIAKVDLAILRLAIYELVIEKKQPPKVIFNEAIELAKEMAAEKSPGFVNAVLGSVYEFVGHK